MIKKTAYFALICGLFPVLGHGATTCSKANLTRCLDSACAINISSNPAARCQYCGTASAGGAPVSGGMVSVSVGASAKYSFTDKELKKAPTDPGARYAWATEECLKKVTGCTPDDVTDNYDKLIEQSCKAAGISAEMSTLRAKSAKTKSKTSCATDIQACLISDTKCGPDWGKCKEDADFDKFFAACSVEATGCDTYIAAVRTEMQTARGSVKDYTDDIAAAYQAEREKKLTAAQNGCKDNASRNSCIETVCERSMRNKCATGYDWERSIATQLCKFHDIACDRLKK